MFRSALVKLTTLYVVLTMALSLIFSFVFYHFATHELNEGLKHQYDQFVDSDHDSASISALPEIHSRSNNLKQDLFYFNVVVLFGSIALGLYMAKRTLKPIEDAHNEQLRFTAEASHELRTPIAAMKADTESMLGQKQPSYDQLKETLKSNLQDIDRLEALTNHLLYMGKFKFQKTEKTKDANLKQALNNSIDLLRRQYKDKVITFDLKTEDISVQIEPVALEQLLTIVLDNAYKYSPNGASVKVSALKRENRVVIKVVDEGTGIPKKDLPHVFEHFYRSSTSSGPHASGYGLGLPLAKDIAEHYGGDITVSSSSSKGTAVTINLAGTI